MRGLPSLALPIVLAAVGTGCADPGPVGPPTEPRPIEVVELPELEAGLAGLRGTPVLVNFWATWCGPCMSEMPALHALAEESGDELAVRLVSWDLPMPVQVGSVEELSAFAAERGMWLPIWAYDGELEPLAERYDLGGSIPESLVFDAQGELVGRHVGAMSLEDLRRFVETSLAGAAG